ncbi:MAG: GNAT family protein [Nanoarchaeota archaeon]|nr:GNAT family protein [Nanoarchaeota archaeon]
MTLNIEKLTREHLKAVDIFDKDKHIIDLYSYASDEVLGTMGVAYIRGGKVIGCGGVAPLWEGVGQSWMVCGKDYMKYWVSVGRLMIDTIESAFTVFNLRRIQGTTEVDNEVSIRFHEWAGYKKEGILKAYGSDGSDHIMFARLRDVS